VNVILHKWVLIPVFGCICFVLGIATYKCSQNINERGILGFIVFVTLFIFSNCMMLWAFWDEKKA